jgi:hypothetical protein
VLYVWLFGTVEEVWRCVGALCMLIPILIGL